MIGFDAISNFSNIILYEKGQDKNNKGKPGQKIGHKGVTRPYATSEQVEVTMACYHQSWSGADK